MQFDYILKFFKKVNLWDFTSSPVAKIPYYQCKETLGLIPGQGELDTMPQLRLKLQFN